MGVKNFSILPDNSAYFPGQTISGRLVVQVDKPTSLEEISLKYHGVGKVKWSETDVCRTVLTCLAGRIVCSPATTEYRAEEEYPSVKQVILRASTDNYKLPVGEHVFVLDIELPADIPCSFESRYGYIRHSLKATIKRSWKFNCNAELPFMVAGASNLNDIARAVAPVAEVTRKTFFGRSGLLEMTIDLPARGIVPGLAAPLKISVSNNSGVEVKSIVLTLRKNLIYYARKRSKKVGEDIYKTKIPISNGLGNQEMCIDLNLPYTPPSYLPFCRIIDLNYQMRIEAKVNSCSRKNLEMHTEIIVGNIPLITQ